MPTTRRSTRSREADVDGRAGALGRGRLEPGRRGLAAHAPARQRLRGPGRRRASSRRRSPSPTRPSFGWVSMVLVHGPYRRRGLATRLVERATAALDRAPACCPCSTRRRPGRRCTPAWGSGPSSGCMRWRGTGGGTAATPPRRRPSPSACATSTARRSAPTAARSWPTSPRAARRSRCVDPAGGRLPALARGPHGDPARAARGPRRGDGRRAAGSAGSTPSPAPSWSTCRSAPRPSRSCSPPRLRARAAVHAHGARARRDRRATPALVHAIAGPELG